MPPKPSAEISVADQAARKELLELIEKKQDAEFRKRYRLIVPEQPSGLNGDYELLIYGKYGDRSASRITVRVTSDQATGELATNDCVLRGELPREDVDRLVRIVFLAYATRREHRDVDAESFSTHFFTSHLAYRTFEVVGQNEDFPFHFKTQPEQWNSSSISHDNDSALKEFIHTRTFEKLWTLCDTRLKPLRRQDEKEYVSAQLRKVSPEKVPGKYDAPRVKVDDYRRDDRAAVDCILFSQLAIKDRVAEAIPEFKRLQLDEELKQLEVVVADDPLSKLQEMLEADRDKNWVRSHWAKCYILNSDDPKLRALLWPDVFRLFELEYDRLANDLLSIKLTREELEVFEKHYDESTKLADKVFVGRVLLSQTKADRYFDYLLSCSKRVPSKQQEQAPTAIMEFSMDTGLRKAEAREVLLSLWERSPSSDRWAYLLPELAVLGIRDDIPKLQPYLDDPQENVVDGAIGPLASLDPDQGLKAAHGQIEKFIQEGGNPRLYYWHVSASFELFFWQRDRSCIPLIQKAIARLDPVDRDHNRNNVHATLFEYLEAETLDARLKAALALEPHFYNRYWKQDVARQLIKEGAEPKQLEPLSNPSRHRHFRYPYP